MYVFSSERVWYSEYFKSSFSIWTFWVNFRSHCSFLRNSDQQTCFAFEWKPKKKPLLVRAHWLPHLFGICWSRWFSSPVPPNVHHTGIPGAERKQPARHCPPLAETFHYDDKPTFPQLVSNDKWKLVWRNRLSQELSVPQGTARSLLLRLGMRGDTGGQHSSRLSRFLCSSSRHQTVVN